MNYYELNRYYHIIKKQTVDACAKIQSITHHIKQVTLIDLTNESHSLDFSLYLNLVFLSYQMPEVKGEVVA